MRGEEQSVSLLLLLLLGGWAGTKQKLALKLRSKESTVRLGGTTESLRCLKTVLRVCICYCYLSMTLSQFPQIVLRIIPDKLYHSVQIRGTIRTAHSYTMETEERSDFPPRLSRRFPNLSSPPRPSQFIWSVSCCSEVSAELLLEACVRKSDKYHRQVARQQNDAFHQLCG